MADALSRRRRVNGISIAYNHDLTSMAENHALENDSAQIFQDLTQGKTQEPFLLNKGFLLHSSRLCMVKEPHHKVMYDSHSPPCAGHCGIEATTQVIEN